MGYIKKSSDIRPRFNLDGYFYPKQVYHPLHHQSEPTIRSAAFPSNLILRQTVHKHSILVPNPLAGGNRARSQFLPVALRLQYPAQNQATEINNPNQDKKLSKTLSLPGSNKEKPFLAVDNDVTTIVEYAPGFFTYLNDGKQRHSKMTDDIHKQKLKLINSVKKIVAEARDNKIPPQIDNAILIDIEKEHTSNIRKSNGDDANLIVVSQIGEGRATNSTVPHTKTFFKPSKIAMKVTATGTPKPIHQKTTKIEAEAELEEEQREPEGELKGPFATFLGAQKEQVIEALKQGGVIIQRLRVRNGGIAIAGPNGVATAGSGGTAIVGPGGIALTHPRSLSIAGPGARVIAVPETTDLEQLALRSNARDLPLEGIVVATGPVVYYNPE